MDVILSVFEPILLLDAAPRNIPMIEIIIVADVNNKIVLGIFSNNISPTFDEPESLVKNAAFPKSRIRILYIVNPIRCGEYQGLSNPSVLIRSSIFCSIKASNSSGFEKLSAMDGFSIISDLT